MVRWSSSHSFVGYLNAKSDKCDNYLVESIEIESGFYISQKLDKKSGRKRFNCIACTHICVLNN